MNPGLATLKPYPFERLKALFSSVQAAELPAIPLTIGEPQHTPPAHVLEVLASSLNEVARYPATRGGEPLRAAIADWLTQRFALPGIDAARQVLPVNGTREALFAIAQTLVTPGENGRVICPNPFYQIYEGAALLAGGAPTFVAADASTGFLPDFSTVDAAAWDRCELLYICNPGNPSGAVMDIEALQDLLTLAEAHNFTVVSDECYSEVYVREDNPPPGLLQAAAAMGNHDYRRCLVFHSLSKRSNLPGLRSGFVAGDADLIDTFFRYRTYHGCAMPLHHQAASVAAWRDESHVIANRALYRAKFDAVLPILRPVLDIPDNDAGFYSWPATPIDDERFAQRVLEVCNVAVLPGRYLGREVNGHNPGAQRVRMAWVATLEDCQSAAQRIAALGEAGW